MKLYSRLDTKDTYFEMWGSSTKHPDVRKTLKSDIENGLFYKSKFIDTVEYNFFQWVCQCLSGLSWGTYNHMIDFLSMCEPYFTKNNNCFY